LQALLTARNIAAVARGGESVSESDRYLIALCLALRRKTPKQQQMAALRKEARLLDPTRRQFPLTASRSAAGVLLSYRIPAPAVSPAPQADARASARRLNSGWQFHQGALSGIDDAWDLRHPGNCFFCPPSLRRAAAPSRHFAERRSHMLTEPDFVTGQTT
jgi:hypothetical protein